MQPLIDNLHELTTGQLSFTLGLILAGALLVQLAIEIGRGLLRVYSDHGQQRLALEKLRLQVQEIRLRCREAGQTNLLWNGSRKFTVAKKARECEDVCALVCPASRQ